jgi:hypothetical protein
MPVKIVLPVILMKKFRKGYSKDRKLLTITTN